MSSKYILVTQCLLAYWTYDIHSRTSDTLIRLICTSRFTGTNQMLSKAGKNASIVVNVIVTVAI